jgi:hypothetical protein
MQFLIFYQKLSQSIWKVRKGVLSLQPLWKEKKTEEAEFLVKNVQLKEVPDVYTLWGLKASGIISGALLTKTTSAKW